MKTKGARLTTQISLPGRFVVLVPQGEGLGVSRRLDDDERNRLKDILKRLNVKEGGVIVRTAAEGASEEDIERDLVFLQRLWRSIQAQGEDREGARARLPGGRAAAARRPRSLHRRLREGVHRRRAHAPTHRRLPEEDVAAHGRARRPLQGEGAAHGDVRRRAGDQARRSAAASTCRPAAISSSTTPRRSPSSTSTPAVSSAAAARTPAAGSRTRSRRTTSRRSRKSSASFGCATSAGSSSSTSSTWRTRRTGATVEEALRTELERDRTKTYVVEISPLGLVEMTRQNVTDGPREVMTRKCPTCGGDGIVYSEASAAIDVERRLRALAAGSRAQAFRVELADPIASALVGPGARRLIELEAITKKRFFLDGKPETHLDHFVVLSEGKLADLAPPAPVAGGGRGADAAARRDRPLRRRCGSRASSTGSTSSSPKRRASSASASRFASSACSTAARTRCSRRRRRRRPSR